MPIVYETPAPVAAAAGVASQLARRSDGGGGGGSGGGGGGRGYNYGSAQPYDTGIQDAILARDRMQFQEQSQVQDTQRGYDTTRMQQEGSMAHDRQRFELQAQLHEVELAQSERMRLQRLKNSLGEVASDPTLTDEEKADFAKQIKFNIDPLQRRLAQEKLAQEKQVKEAMVEQRRASAALTEEQQKVAASTFDQRTKYFVPPDVLASITEDFSKNIGPTLTAQFGPQAAQQMIGKMAEQEAMKQGLGQTFFQQSPGKWEAMGAGGDRDMGGGASGAAGRGKGQTDHPTGLSPQDYLKARESAESQAHREQSMSTTNELGTKSNVHPQTVEWKNERVKQILSDMGLPPSLNEYNASKQPAEGKKGYQSKFAPPKADKVAAAATGGAADQKPFDFRDVKSQTPEQRAQVSHFADVGKEIMGASGSFEERQTAAAALSEAQVLFMNSGSVSNMDAAQKKKYVDAMNTVAGVLKGGEFDPDKPKPPVQAAGGYGSAEPWWQRAGTATYGGQSVTGGTRIEGGGVAPTPAEAVGGVARKAYKIAYDTAPPLPGFVKRN